MTDSRAEARAMTLFERLGAWQRAGRPAASASARREVCAVVDRWRKIIAGGDAAFFETRLGWDGLDEESVLEALAWVSENPEVAHTAVSDPGWRGELREMFWTGIRLLDDELTRRLQVWANELGLPFVELWAPWVVAAGAVVGRHEVVVNGLVSAEGLDSLLRHLLRQITDLGSEAAYSHFNKQRSTELSAVSDRGGSVFYRGWLGTQMSDAAAPLFDEYPVLARQLRLVLKTWTESTIEVFDRFERDRQAVEDAFAGPDGLGVVIEIHSGLSDRHHGGRRVAILEFEGGGRVVYKPRSLAIDAAFVEFLEWMVREGLEPLPTIPKFLKRHEYGWMEFIEAEPLGSPEDVSRWFTAAGVLLFSAHVLRGSDLHFDNVLVGSASPVLIDLETLMHPELTHHQEAGGNTTAAARVADWMKSSFQSTGMLSFLQEGPDGAVIDIGGLCGTGGHEIAEGTTGWVQLGCDGLHKVSRETRTKVRRNVPVLGGESSSVAGHLADLQTGFSAAYRLVMERRQELLDGEHVARWFNGARTRVLLRPTEHYARVLQLSVSPRCQVDGIATGLAIEAINRGVFQAGPRPAQWDVVAWERRELENLDIPRVTADVDSVVLEDPAGLAVKGVIAVAGWEAFRERLGALAEADLLRQLHLMALSLDSPPGPEGHAASEMTGDDSTIEDARVEPLPREVLVDAARAIADELTALAVEGDDRSVIWLDPVHLRPQDRRDRGVSYYLYSGSAGIALFFAALYRVAPEPAYREMVNGALKPVVTILGAPNAAVLLAEEGIGACHGLGGIVYALTLIADLLGAPEYLDLAHRMAAHITPARIAADEALDVEGGAAGAILGLLALQSRSPRADVLDAARTCGRHLLDRQEPGPKGGAAWPARQGGMLAGFAHGASGGALALIRLWRHTHDRDLLEAGGRALDFENTLFDPASRNWPLQLHDAEGIHRETRNMVAWCHGAPGVAMARAGVLDVLPQADDAGLLRAAVDTTLAAPVTGVDHLCCGTLGRVDILQTVGSVLGRQELQRAAEARAAMAFRLATSQGSFRLGAGGGSARPGFFRGLAGIGYQMLRLCHPGELPSVLALNSNPAEGSLEIVEGRGREAATVDGRI